MTGCDVKCSFHEISRLHVRQWVDHVKVADQQLGGVLEEHYWVVHVKGAE